MMENSNQSAIMNEIKVFEMQKDCLNNIRQKLFNQCENFDPDMEEFKEIIDKFKAKIAEAKESVSDYEKDIDTKDTSDIDRPLANIMLSERSKLIAQLMQMAQTRMSRLKQETGILREQYRELSIEMINSKVTSVRYDFIALIKYLEVLIQIDVLKSSKLYTMFKEFFIKDIYQIVPLLADLLKYTFDHIGWPQTNVALRPEISKNLTDYQLLFVSTFRSLLELESGRFSKRLQIDSETFQSEIFTSINEERIIYHPFDILFEPFVKRFDHHFMDSGSKLNDLEHPEWYLCTLEQWITLNESFLRDLVDQTLILFFDSDNGKFATVELISCFVKLIEQKLRQDLPRMEDNDHIFGRTIDELIIFSKQLNLIVPDLYENHPKLSPLFDIFSDTQNYKRFLNIERNRINECIENILDSETSWNSVYEHDLAFENEFIICEAADGFAALINRQIERSKHIPLDKLRNEYLHLIINMIDDFRLRLSQKIHDLQEKWPFSEKFFGILNTFDFIHSMSMDLASKQMLPQSDLDRVNEMFIHMIDEISNRVINLIVSDFINHLSLYKQLKWHGMSLQGDQPIEVTNEAITLFNDISTKIHLIQKNISKNLFNRLIYEIAGRLQEAFFENFIMELQFNKDGIKQLRYDFEHAFKAIFIIYSDHNIVFTFSTISDCLVVFDLNPQTYHIIQARHKVDSEKEFRLYLQTLGIYSLKPSTVLALIDRRVGFN